MLRMSVDPFVGSRSSAAACLPVYFEEDVNTHVLISSTRLRATRPGSRPSVRLPASRTQMPVERLASRSSNRPPSEDWRATIFPRSCAALRLLQAGDHVRPFYATAENLAEALISHFNPTYGLLTMPTRSRGQTVRRARRMNFLIANGPSTTPSMANQT
jgi:hypothetical protein